MTFKREFCCWAAPIVFRSLGMDFFRRHEWLISTREWPAEKRAQWRLEKLNQMIGFCWDHVPFYQDFWKSAGVSNSPLQSIDDLDKFPILTKDIIKKNHKQIQPDSFTSIPKKLNSTGGTTGQPLQYFQDLELWSLSQAFNLWGWGLAGYGFGDRVAIIGGYSLVPSSPSFKDRIRYFLERKIPISGVHFDEEAGHNIYRLLRQQKPDFIYGYPSVLAMLGAFLADEGLRLESVRGVFTTAEMLHDSYRKSIERGFNCITWDQYGCNDGGIMAHECRLHQGHHYNDLQAIAQITGPDSSEPGQLLISNLWNRSFPFIRYANGDFVAFSDEPCPCGEPFPLFSSIKGRTSDILEFANGRKLSGPALTLIFRDLDIAAWQVIQIAPTILEVHISNSKPLPENSIDFIRLAFTAHAGKDVVVKIKEVRELQRTSSGKLKPVISAMSGSQNGHPK